MKKQFFLVFALFAAMPMFAADEPAATRSQGSFWQTLIMIAIAIVFFYFILWRPEQKRRKEVEKKRSAMKKGDRVTAMGVVGIIDKIKEQTVIVKTDESRIEFLKGAITEVKSKEEASEEAPQDSSKIEKPGN